MADVLRADIVGRDMGASAALRGYARQAGVAAETVRRLAEAQDAQRRAAMASAGATIAAAKADRILEDAADDAIRATVEQRIATEKLAKSSKDAAGSGGLGALAGLGGAGAGGGMGALIAAGVALSPVLLTVGTGLGGMGLAALAAGKNSKILKQELVPLKAQFAGFQKELQPVVLRDFAGAAGLAGIVLHGVEPVAAATGKALGGILAEVGAEFRSGEWQRFFAFMARQAAPDMRLLGDTAVQLLGTIPALTQDLQPLARGLLVASDDTAKLTHSLAGMWAAGQRNFPLSTQHTFNFLRDLDHWTVQLTNHIPGAHAVNNWLSSLQGDANGTAAAQRDLGAATHNTTLTLAGQVKELNVAAGAYERAIAPLDNYINATITEYNDLHTLRQALRASGDTIGYKTQKERDSFAAAQGYIDQTLKQGNAALSAHKGIDQQITSIEKALPVLEHVKGKTADYRAELQLLKNMLDKLRAERLISQMIHVQGLGQWSVSQSLAPGTGHRRAAGGLLRGPGTPTSDSIPVWASTGEYWVKAAAVNKYGVALFDKLNAMQFAGGGLVPSYSGSVAGMAPWVKQDDAATIRLIDQAVVRATVAGMRAAQQAAAGGFGGHGVPPSGPIQSYARRLVGAVWPGLGEWLAFADIVARESNWNPFATNPTSGAYGIPQALPPGKMASAGADWRTNPFTQLRWMVGYIRSRWGDPLAADFNERNAHWYGSGLRGGVFRQPQLIGVGDTPERVDITPLGRGRSGGGALVHVGTMVVQDATDVQLVSRQLDFLLTSASLGT